LSWLDEFDVRVYQLRHKTHEQSGDLQMLGKKRT